MQNVGLDWPFNLNCSCSRLSKLPTPQLHRSGIVQVKGVSVSVLRIKAGCGRRERGVVPYGYGAHGGSSLLLRHFGLTLTDRSNTHFLFSMSARGLQKTTPDVKASKWVVTGYVTKHIQRRRSSMKSPFHNVHVRCGLQTLSQVPCSKTQSTNKSRVMFRDAR